MSETHPTADERPLFDPTTEPGELEAPAARPAADAALTVVGVGASAGGLEALERLFQHTPEQPGVAFVVVQHLSPDFKSLMGELLGKHTSMPIRTAEDGARIEPNHVYLNPPRATLTYDEGTLRVRPPPEGPGPHFPIDVFLRSLAKGAGERAVGIILSGTGSDGMRGVRAIKEAGGMVIVQEPVTARFDGMPRSALSTGLVDHVLAPDIMAERLTRFLSRAVPLPEPTEGSDTEEEVRRILAVLHEHQRIDFSGYKDSTVLRRIDRRAAAVQCETLAEYRELLASSPREMATLRKELLIGVTKFFRDSNVFEYVRREVIPLVVDSGHPKEPVRAWVAGCATGEEAYSYAMLFAEHLESVNRAVDVQIFATDVDRDAIDYGSIGAYPESIAADVPPELLSKYFERRSDAYLVKSRIRQMVVFATQNLIQDPPFTRMDLVSCRNLLIYLRPELQQKALSLFAFGLRAGGHLVLGSSESVGEMSDRFETVDAKNKVYRSRGNRRGAFPGGFTLSQTSERLVERRKDRRPMRTDDEAAVVDATELLLQSHVPTAVLVDEDRMLVHVFNDTSELVRLPTGSTSLDILKLVERRIATVLASLLQRVFGGGPPELVYRDVASAGLPQQSIDLRVRLLPTDHVSGRRFALVFFERHRSPDDFVARPAGEETDAEKQLVAMEQELKSTRENLQATIEELETSNEELQATNEELLASNEELQSTNEELQSVNEELYTVNAEYQKKIDELTELTSDMDNLLRSSSIGTVFLDAQLCVRKFTPTATEYVNLISADVGRPIHHISTRLRGSDFHRALERVLTSHGPVDLECQLNESERWALMRFHPYRDVDDEHRGVVITFVDITALKRSESRLQSTIDSLLEHLAVLDQDGVITEVNEAWRAFARNNGPAVHSTVDVGASYLAVCDTAAARGDEDARIVAEGLRRVLAGELVSFTHEYPCHGPDRERWFLMYASRLPSPEGGAVVSHIDVTSRRLGEPDRGARHGDSTP